MRYGLLLGLCVCGTSGGLADAGPVSETGSQPCTPSTAQPVAPPDHPLAATVGPDGLIYVATSILSRPANVSTYNPSTNAWATFTPLPTTTYLNGYCNVAAATTSKIYFMYSCIGHTAALVAYDSPTTSWQTRTATLDF